MAVDESASEFASFIKWSSLYLTSSRPGLTAKCMRNDRGLSQFEALDVPWIPPEHCKYNNILVFFIVVEALEVPWIWPEHCKYNNIMFVCIVFQALEYHEDSRALQIQRYYYLFHRISGTGEGRALGDDVTWYHVGMWYDIIAGRYPGPTRTIPWNKNSGRSWPNLLLLFFGGRRVRALASPFGAYQDSILKP